MSLLLEYNKIKAYLTTIKYKYSTKDCFYGNNNTVMNQEKNKSIFSFEPRKEQEL